MGLFNLRSEAEHAAAQIPALRAQAVQTAFHVLHGANPRKRPGAGEAFWQFREYEPGDMPREIDWRQSAKTDRVFIRQKEQHSAQSCLFWTKRNADMHFKSDTSRFNKGHTASVLALTLALLHSRGGEMVGFAGAQRLGHSERTLGAFEHLLVGDDDAPLPASLSVPRHAHFYALSDFLEPVAAIEAALQPITERTRNGWMIATLDPAELALPYQGRIIFEDMGGAQRTPIDNAVDIRGAYQARMEGHLADLQALAASWGWGFIVHDTSTPIEETALKIWLENAQ